MLVASVGLGFWGALLDQWLLYEAWLDCFKQLDAGGREYLNVLLVTRIILLPVLVAACICFALLARARILPGRPDPSGLLRTIMGVVVVTSGLAPVAGMIIFDLETEGLFDRCFPSVY
ncbi:hypothetical protein [Nonomuraea sp. KM90]|uniref:hypothetical protein n=1 Tax=Nonomuraea sp. KM90 TaxID=3457428 RepID=UPI003FCD0438